MPEELPPDNRRVILAVVVAAMVGSWVLIGTFLGYERLPRTFIFGLIIFDLAMIYFIWRLLGPRDGG